MRPHSRKEREIWQACDQLSAEGANITYQEVGKRLIQLGYKRGSNSDIYRYLSTWKKMQERAALNKKVPLETKNNHPKMDLLYQAVEKVREDIWLEATKALNETQRQLAQTEQALKEAQETIADLEAQLAGQQRMMDALTANQPTTETLHTLLSTVQGLSTHRDVELAKLYDHHQEQFDRYMKMIENLKVQNQKLRRLLAAKGIADVS